MSLRWAMAVLHLLALGIGLGAIWARFLTLRAELDRDRLRRVFYADTLWGVAGALWLGTGLVRLLGGLEKATDYYLGNSLFHIKLGLFVLILVLEVAPMVALIRWRARARRSQSVDTSSAMTYARISLLQALLVTAIVGLAVAIARGSTL